MAPAFGFPVTYAPDGVHSEPHVAKFVDCVAGAPVISPPAARTPLNSRRSHIVLPLTGAAGSVVCIAAFLEPAHVHPGSFILLRDGGGAWPHWLFVVIAALCFGALLLVAALFLRLKRSRRHTDPDAYEKIFEPPPVSQATAALLLAMTVLLLILAIWALWSAGHATAPLPWIAGQPGNEPTTAAPPLLGHASVAHSPFAGFALAAVALLAAVAVFTFMWWLYFGGTRLRAVPSSTRASATVRQAVEKGSDALQFGGNPGAAIIACYAGFEQLLAVAGLERTISETTNEFTHEASRHFRLPADALHTLAHLYELSRFGDRPMDENDRMAAWGALDVLKAALGDQERHAKSD